MLDKTAKYTDVEPRMQRRRQNFPAVKFGHHKTHRSKRHAATDTEATSLATMACQRAARHNRGLTPGSVLETERFSEKWSAQWWTVVVGGLSGAVAVVGCCRLSPPAAAGAPGCWWYRYRADPARSGARGARSGAAAGSGGTWRPDSSGTVCSPVPGWRAAAAPSAGGETARPGRHLNAPRAQMQPTVGGGRTQQREQRVAERQRIERGMYA